MALSHVQAIIESDPFGIDYMSIGAEKRHGTVSAAKLHCECYI